MAGPLEGIRIVDLTAMVTGPMATMMLADQGADVIKVEPPGGDMSRTLPPKPPDREGCDYGGYFASINRSKRSIVLDLKNEDDRALVFDMVERVDAVADHIREAMKHIPVERLVISSDCGMGREGMSRRHALYKMGALVQGTNIVRKEVGAPEAECLLADPKYSLTFAK